jgi:hypothetical protein
MDPNLFHIDWERTIEALVGIIIVSFLVERACALLFESRWWIAKFEDARVVTPSADSNTKLLPGHRYPLKEIISFLVALLICYFWQFDAVSIILLSEHTILIGIVITALVAAGGSKASIKLFHDALNIKSSAATQREILKEQDKKSEYLK